MPVSLLNSSWCVRGQQLAGWVKPASIIGSNLAKQAQPQPCVVTKRNLKSVRAQGQQKLSQPPSPLQNAFQATGAKESILKVEGTGDGELADLVEDFNEGRIQFAFLKVKDPNSGLPKNVLIAWCGGGVPERTKGYFTSHLAAVSKILHGYHVQITARSDSDIVPENIIQSAGRINPLVAARNRKDDNVDEDGWGADAPNSRELGEKVESAYKPTKVNMAELTQQPSGSSGYGAPTNSSSPDVVRGAYQPIGKVDIAAIRAAAKNQDDLRPTPVKGAYEPVGKVDIAAIRARAQGAPAKEEPEQPVAKSLSERSAAFSQPQQPERLTSLPKPKVSNKFGSAASSFTGTKPPAPGGSGLYKAAAPAPPVIGAASRTFADQGGKTPAQIWAEKKGKGVDSVLQAPLGRDVAAQKTGESEQSGGHRQDDDEPTSGGGISALRDRFKDTQPISAQAPSAHRAVADAPPRLSRARLDPWCLCPSWTPISPSPADEEEYDEPEPERSPSPPRVAVPVPRSPSPPPAREPSPPRSLPTRPREEEPPRQPSPVRERDNYRAPAIAAGVAAGVGAGAAAAAVAHSYENEQEEEVEEEEERSGSGHRAIVVYDYEKAEDNEVDLREDEYVVDIDMVDDDWWLGTNSQGDRGLFPSNYVKLVEGGDEDAMVAQEIPEPAAPSAPSAGPTATASFDYEAAEDNELSFGEGDIITDLEFPDEDWWFGHFNGDSGLFPANYVELNHLDRSIRKSSRELLDRVVLCETREADGRRAQAN
ncbi:unnamed protein product [Parascedosporium putredinis]|uniref:Actin binding protein n=1 Tax=Parascedosporium putredinis TaxID=1442378 RepID=A0A9P1H4R1_9PEZI|nr:unnamed protein product [Parascedosporium putredinis]CAI7998522.1 unnamed protein product [Parascedosporium putredinis]